MVLELPEQELVAQPEVPPGPPGRSERGASSLAGPASSAAASAVSASADSVGEIDGRAGPAAVEAGGGAACVMRLAPDVEGRPRRRASRNTLARRLWSNDREPSGFDLRLDSHRDLPPASCTSGLLNSRTSTVPELSRC